MMIERNFPHSPEAEEAIVATAILNERVVPYLISEIKSDYFYRSEYKIVFPPLSIFFRKTRLLTS